MNLDSLNASPVSPKPAGLCERAYLIFAVM